MSESCNHDCSSCGQSCSERKDKPADAKEKLHVQSSVRRVIGIVSGKGGVGKSMVTSLLASMMRQEGLRTAVLDADMTGPSIPRAFGLQRKAYANAVGILPVCSEGGVQVMSINLLLENETDPVVWRGPVIANAVKQFWTDVIWQDVDYMFVDMPPGTGDVPLTVFQSLPIDGIVVVASPQELVGMIVEKAVNMAAMMNVPVLGLVENMSGFRCPDCGKVHNIFGESHIEQIAQAHGIDTVCHMPLDPQLAAAVDRGAIETVRMEELQPMLRKLRAGE